MTNRSPLVDLVAGPPAQPLDVEAMDAAKRRWATRAKPPGSLGRLEDLAAQVAGITGRCPAVVPNTAKLVVFAGDHGVVAENVTAWPQQVTAFMVETMAAGQAAVSVLAAASGVEVTVVDVGVASDVTHLGGVVHRKVRPGTANIANEPAMTRTEASSAVEVGGSVAKQMISAGADMLVGGEMGIGNTTPATALIATITGASPSTLCGPGAGLDSSQLGHKSAVIGASIDRVLHQSTIPLDGVELLAQLAGLEIAALTGFYLEAAKAKVPCIIDGVIALSALCVADLIAPGTAQRMIAGHRSSEPAASAALDHFGLSPVLDLDLRLGEGTGACLAVPIVNAAIGALADMADLPEV